MKLQSLLRDVACLAWGWLAPTPNLRVPGVEPPPAPAEIARRTAVLEAYGRLPLDFEANAGQTDARVKFLARTRGGLLFLTAGGASWHSRHADSWLHMKLAGSRPDARIRGLEELPGRSNYFKGSDPKLWRTNVPHYAKVEYQGVYPGVNLVYHGTERQLEYDFVVSRGADPTRIALQFEGADSIHIDPRGDLVVHTPAGEFRQRQPAIYQETAGGKRSVPGGYALDSEGKVRFRLAPYDRSRPLIIDPLVYSTYLGGSGSDEGEGIAVDSSGNAYITGATASADFPSTPGAFSRAWVSAGIGDGTVRDAFVTKLNSTGTALVYSTYLGGRDDD